MEAKKYVWEGAIPLQIHLHESDITTHPPPPPALCLKKMGVIIAAELKSSIREDVFSTKIQHKASFETSEEMRFRRAATIFKVLSRLCGQPIIVYIPEHEHNGWGSGFIPIAEYGAEFRKGSKTGKAREVVRLLYSGRNHYDLLL